MTNLGEQASGQLDDRGLGALMKILAASLLVAGIALTLANTSGVMAAVGIGVLIFLASFASGSFLGFLFGVPRVLSNEAVAASSVSTQIGEIGAGAAPAPATTSAKLKSNARLLQSNTNLERISDWLTTMLVGAGLVELHRVNDGLFMFRQFLSETAKVFPADVTGGAATAGMIPAIGPVVLVFGASAGFLFMYLNTRLVLIRLFQAIERLLAGDEVLPPDAQRSVRAFVTATDGTPSFVGNQVSAGKGATINDALGLMFDMLYKSDPQRVIDLGAQISQTEAVNRAEYWFYLAAAFGQKLHDAEPGGEVWTSARDNALDCARRAVSIDPSYRDRLWSISVEGSSDDDLAPLRKDGEFLRIVRRT